ncbi:substrate-binding domain-containing protein [Schaalia sp. lx-100]|uniref:substrate-binding domain-containing protein n=1 Tax=Schaalia sp. lx-100 TaxID=2899081 RepID=UPI001E604A49|nr:substrate-binding domain-containing protein [Schaalia sp. lx-100]MCD4557473.1 substrate-binding domain-containing protein [Schaalia sp. lx-100]
MMRKNMRQLSCATLILAACSLAACSSATGGLTFPADSFGYSTPTQSGEQMPQARNASDDLNTLLRHGTGTVTVAYMSGQPLPEALVKFFEENSGFTLVQHHADSTADLPEHVDVIVGVDDTDAQKISAATNVKIFSAQSATIAANSTNTHVPDALAYGRDDVCVHADTSWYSANRIDIPSGIDSLTDTAYSGRLVIPDPHSSAEGRSFAQLIAQMKGTDALTWISALRGNGVTIASDMPHVLSAWSAADVIAESSSTANKPQSTEEHSAAAPTTSSEDADRKPLIVAAQSVAAVSRDNTGTQTAAQVVSGTCVQRIVRALGVVTDQRETLSEGTESFMAFLTSPAGQRLIAQTGWVRPIEEGHVEATPAQWFFPIQEDAAVLSEELLADPVAAVKNW